MTTVRDFSTEEMRAAAEDKLRAASAEFERNYTRFKRAFSRLEKSRTRLARAGKAVNSMPPVLPPVALTERQAFAVKQALERDDFLKLWMTREGAETRKSDRIYGIGLMPKLDGRRLMLSLVNEVNEDFCNTLDEMAIEVKPGSSPAAQAASLIRAVAGIVKD